MFTEAKLFHKAGEGSGGGDQHNLGWYATESALTTAYPTANDGDWAIVGATDTVWTWDSDTTAWVDTDQKGQVTSVNGHTGAVTIGANDVLPSQTGNAGKFLMTDGTDASWSDKPLVNTATGTNALTILGSSSTASQSINIGVSSQATRTSAITIGTTAKALHDAAIAIGANSIAGASSGASSNWDEIAIGNGAEASAKSAIQLGYGTNNDADTFQVWNHRLLNRSDGTIPTARLAKVNTTVTLTSAGWSGGSQTVTVTGMTATGVVLVSPDPTDQADYTSAGIICTAQAADSLTFTATTTPSADIDVNVVML